MYRVSLFSFFIFFPVILLAAESGVITFDSYNDTHIIENPEQSQIFYGELTGFPHTYEFEVSEPINLLVQVLVPNIEEADNNRSAIIVRRKVRGVDEVARLSYKDANWGVVKDDLSGDSYRAGASFEGRLKSGVYVLEVNTAENLGKYVLSLGEFGDYSELSYFEKLVRIYEAKRFFGKSPIAILRSRYYYIPIMIFTIIGIGFYVRRKTTCLKL